jgi:N-acetylglucosaminyl-diphospho-decaprenol L-rhamnosyltransferase
MKLSVIIVSYNVRHYLEQCILSVMNSGRGMDYEIFVVDNASTDGTPSLMKRHFPKREFPQLHLISNKDNMGFGRANNEALRMARGEFILFLNPDTILTERTLNDCCTFMESHDDAGALGVRMLHPNGTFALESRRGLPTPFAAACKIFGLTRLFPKSKLFGRYYMQYLDEHSVCKIAVVSGAFMMARREVLAKTGGFDEKFFMYGEDIDLSYRISHTGKQNYYLPTPILHYKGESTERSSFRYVHVFYNAMLIFFNKHFKRSYFLLSVPVHLAIYAIAFYSLIAYNFERWRNWLRPEHNENVNYLFLGQESHFKEVKLMAMQWGWNVHCEVADGQSLTREPGQNTSADKYQYVVYDTDAFSMEQILQHLEASDHNCSVGTYYSKRRTLITGQKIFTL